MLEKVAIVDDEPGVRRALKRLVEANGFSTQVYGFADVPLRRIDSFIPTLESSVSLTDLITSVLLFSQARIYHSRALRYSTQARYSMPGPKNSSIADSQAESSSAYARLAHHPAISARLPAPCADRHRS